MDIDRDAGIGYGCGRRPETGLFRVFILDLSLGLTSCVGIGLPGTITIPVAHEAVPTGLVPEPVFAVIAEDAVGMFLLRFTLTPRVDLVRRCVRRRGTDAQRPCSHSQCQH